VIENCALNEYSKGENTIYIMNELKHDLSAPPIFIDKVNEIHTLMIQSDSLTLPIITKLENLRKSISPNIKNLILKSDKNYNFKNTKSTRPFTIDYEYINETDISENIILTDEKIKEIIAEIELFKFNICKLMLENSAKEKSFRLENKELKPFSNSQEKIKAITSFFEKQNLNSLEKETAIEIYSLLTKTNSDWEKILMNYDDWIEFSMNLTTVEHLIFRVRTIALSTFEYQIGCRGDYNFSHIEPIINGPKTALVNDSISFEVFTAAYNYYINPEVKINKGAELVKIENGKAYLRTITPLKGDLEIEGEISYRKKNGEPVSKKWKHTIHIQ
jgi:hypothetical protein